MINKVENKIIRVAEENYRQCTTCIMDTTDPWITFRDDGRCNHCLRVELFRQRWDPAGNPRALEQLMDQVKRDGRGQDYDVVSGLSGGVDSSYLAVVAKQFGLRMLIIHVDTGWNSELAVSNIENIVNKLGFDLDTYVVDWEEMRDVQLAFFKSGVPNQDIPQDHAITAGFIRCAAKHKIKWRFNGSNLSCESILPAAWGYNNMDLRHIRDIHNRFGTGRLRHFPMLSFTERTLRFQLLHAMNDAQPLDLLPYNKAGAMKTLEREVGWRYYGGKHYESRFTKFFQAWYLPTKWGYDKRLAHLSSLVVSGQMTREAALAEFQFGVLPTAEVEADKDYMASKLAISRADFDGLMQVPNTSHAAYAITPRSVIRALGIVKRFSARIHGFRRKS